MTGIGSIIEEVSRPLNTERAKTEEVVKLTDDPFKTGNKHFMNMLRPTL